VAPTEDAGSIAKGVLEHIRNGMAERIERLCYHCQAAEATEDKEGRFDIPLCDRCRARAAEERVAIRLGEAEIPRRYREARRADIDAVTWRRVQSWIGSEGWALVLLGPTGCGKSHLAAATLVELAHQNVSMLWRSVPALIDQLKEFERATELMERLTRVRVLVLDDLAAARLTDFGLDRVATLVQARYDGCRRTIVTTNLEASAIGELHGRMASRLLGTGDGATVIKLGGSDRRQKRAKGAA